jgi:hypothetical protein
VTLDSSEKLTDFAANAVEFAINLAAAKSLGLQIPSGVLAIADEVIE